MKTNKVDEWNKNFKLWNGFDDNNNTWIVLGDTFDIKDEIKSKGGKFCRELGWHFDHIEPGYQLYSINIDDITDKYYDGRLYFSDEVWDLVKDIKNKYTIYEPDNSNWVGEVGKKIDFDGILKNYRSYYGNFGETGIFEFEDENGNTIVWMTSPDKEIDDKHIYWIEGTVKSHDEFRGKKSTRITRCRIKGVYNKNE